MGFRTRHIEVDALRCETALAFFTHSPHGMPSWLRQAQERGDVIFATDHIMIKTRSGVVQADHHDWIVYGADHAISPCKPDLFKATYEQID